VSRAHIPPGRFALTNLTNPPTSATVVAMLLNLYEAKTRLSSLVDLAAQGTEIVIAKNGKPRAKLVPVRRIERRQPGRAKGKIWIAADFDAPLPAPVLEGFAGKGE
jgi:prevent-host-death family protein